jgi:hypothetical protein
MHFWITWNGMRETSLIFFFFFVLYSTIFKIVNIERICFFEIIFEWFRKLEIKLEKSLIKFE